jgi:hypothetical protein
MLNLFTGLLREAMGINSEERRVAERVALQREVEKETKRLIATLVRSRDAFGHLAEHWLRLYATQQELDASAGRHGIEHEGRLALKMMARWAVIGDQAFDALPILGARMSCVDEIDGARAWIGTAQQMLLACDGARRRGIRIAADSEQRVTRFYREDVLVATLLEDPDHAARGPGHLIAPSTMPTAEIVERLDLWLRGALAALART